MQKYSIDDINKRLSSAGRYSSDLSNQFIQTRIYNLDSFSEYPNPSSKSSSPKSFRLSLLTFISLTLVGLTTTLIACFIDLVAFYLIQSKKVLVHSIETESLACLAWVLISLLFIMCATSFGYFFAPEADGSGLPEVKSIISGVEMPGYLTLKTLICKVFGLICCSGALSIGKEGPHAHIALIVAHQTLKLPLFTALKSHPGIKTQILQSSVAAGVSAVMAAPIGSVFFSMELTATFFMVHSFIYSLYCGLVSSCVLIGYRLLSLTEVVSQTHIPKGYNNADLLVFAVIGLIAGIAGVTFTQLTKTLVQCRSQKKVPWLHKRYRYAGFVTVLYSTTVFFLPFMMLNAKQSLNQLLSAGNLGAEWAMFGEIGCLAVFSIAKMGFTATSTSVQIPGGVFLPVMLSGAAFGRIMHGIAVAIGGEANVAMFAAVSGAAFVAATTHSLSVSLIIFEMTGQMHYVVPMLLTVIIAYSIGYSLGLNMYDAMIVLKQIQYLPAVRKTKLYLSKACEIMDPAVFLSRNATNKQLRDIFFNKTATKIALVDESGFVLADFNINSIPKYLEDSLRKYKDYFSSEQMAKVRKNIWNEEFEDDGSRAKLGPDDIRRKWSNESPEKTTLVRWDSDESESGLRQRVGFEDGTSFWDESVNFQSRIFKLNKAPVIIQANTALNKVHFLFLMLGLMQIYVVKDFKLVGTIYRHYFTDSKKT
jgi:chloride channel 2